MASAILVADWSFFVASGYQIFIAVFCRPKRKRKWESERERSVCPVSIGKFMYLYVSIYIYIGRCEIVCILANDLNVSIANCHCVSQMNRRMIVGYRFPIVL